MYRWVSSGSFGTVRYFLDAVFLVFCKITYGITSNEFEDQIAQNAVAAKAREQDWRVGRAACIRRSGRRVTRYSNWVLSRTL